MSTTPDLPGTVRIEKHAEDDFYPGHSVWVLVQQYPPNAALPPHDYWICVHSDAPGNVGCHSDEFQTDDGDNWPIGKWEKVDSVYGTPAYTQDFEEENGA